MSGVLVTLGCFSTENADEFKTLGQYVIGPEATARSTP